MRAKENQTILIQNKHLKVPSHSMIESLQFCDVVDGKLVTILINWTPNIRLIISFNWYLVIRISVNSFNKMIRILVLLQIKIDKIPFRYFSIVYFKEILDQAIENIGHFMCCIITHGKNSKTSPLHSINIILYHHWFTSGCEV